VAIGVSVDNTTGTYLPNPQVLQQTTIATLASQTSFTLTAGSADNDVYNGQTLIVQDASTSTQKAVGTVLDYVGATKTITLSADPAIFTMAVGDSVSIVAGAGSSGGGSAPTASAIADEVQTRTIARVTLVDALTTYTGNTPQTGDSFARIGAAGAGLTSLAPAATALSTAVWTATIANRIDVAVSTRLAPLVAGRDLSVAATTGAVELDSADKATLVDLIWDEPLTGATHNVATSSGKRLRQTTAFQQIDSTVIDAAATTTTFVTGLTSSVDDFYNDSMLVFTDGALAGQVRAIYDYIGATKTIILAEALTSAPVDGVAFAVISLHIHPVSQIQNGLALAATALSTTQWSNGLATDLGTTNTTVATNINATVSSRSTQTSVDTIDDLLDTEMPALTASVAAEAVKTSAIKAKTDNLPADPADASDIASSFSTVNTKLDTIDDFLDTEIAAIKAKTDNLPTDPADQSLVEAAITAATSPLATPAQVNAEVVDVLSVDTFAELAAPPAATSSLKDKLTWLFMYARNKVTQTATTRTLYRDDTTTVAGTSGTSDNGTTFTKGEDA
jgi:hypothetical protein